MFNFRIDSEIQRAHPSVFKALDASGLAYFIKNAQREYVHANQNFLDLIQKTNISNLTDFDLFISEVASEQKHIEDKVLTSLMPDSTDAVVVGKNQLEKVFNIHRSVFEDKGEHFIVGVVKDITESKQKEQFKAYKQVLTGEELYEKLINRFSSYIFTHRDMQTILDGVGKLCLDLIKIEDVSIFLFDTDKNTLEEHCYMGRGHDEKYKDHQALSIPLNEGIVGLAARTSQTVLVNNVDRDKRHLKGVLEARSELAVPIIYKKRLIGVIDSESSDNQFYTKRHVQLMEGIAGLLAIKLHELQKQKEVEQKQAQLAAFIQSAPTVMVMLDKELNYLAISKKWREYYGVERDEDILGKNHLEMTPNLSNRWKKMIQLALNGETQVMDKEVYNSPDGRTLWYTAKLSPWYTETEELGGILIFIDLITDKVSTEDALNFSNEALHQARVLGKLYTWSFDPETGHFEWSAGDAEQNSQLSASRIRLNSLFDVVEPAYQADFTNAINKAVKENSSFNLTHPIEVGGQKYWLRTSGRVVADDHGIQRIEGTAQDISDQVLIEESLKRKNEELEKINHELDQFVYKTAHDLRTPLTNLIGLIEVMKNETNPQLLQTYFDLQQKSVERMDAFIHKITNYTKNTRLPIQENHINCQMLIDEVLHEYLYFDKSEVIEKAVELNIEKDIHTDQERLKSILSNLVSNAIKFADLNKDQPSLKIAIRTAGNNFEIRVSDNGIGIDKALHSKVFDMFFRGHNTADGAGIGLYIVKETIMKLNGKISLTSDEGKGTEIRINLPNLNPEIL